MKSAPDGKLRLCINMSDTFYSDAHVRLCQLLVERRKKAGLTQEQLAAKLNRPQSFVAKYEGGERRLDIIELIAISKAIGFDLSKLIRDLTSST